MTSSHPNYTTQRPHLQISSHGDWGYNILIVGGHGSGTVHSIEKCCREKGWAVAMERREESGSLDKPDSFHCTGFQSLIFLTGSGVGILVLAQVLFCTNQENSYVEYKTKNNKWTNKTKNTLIDTDTSVVVKREEGWWGDVVKGKEGQIYGNRRIDLGWWTHKTIYRWCIIEMYTGNLCNFINQCYSNQCIFWNAKKILLLLFIYQHKQF